MGNLTIDIDGICNERCIFCYQNLDGSVLPEEEIMRLIYGSDADIVDIGGGEPFLDNRIVRIIRAIRERGKKVNISTNATVIPAGLLNLEQRTKEGTQIQASLHASNSELYEHITGRNFFDNVIENIKLLKDNFSMVLSSAIYQDNFSDVQNIVDLASQFNIPLRVNLVFPIGKGKNVKLLTYEQINSLRDYLILSKIQGKCVDSPLIHLNNCSALKLYYGMEKQGKCPADFGDRLYVSPKGKKSKCSFLEVA